MSSTDYAISTSGLTKRFSDRIAVNNIDLNVRSGSAFGLLGPNGAGKTTLIRMLVGLANPTEGHINVLGHSIPQEKLTALSMVGAIVEEPRFHPFLNGRENLEIVASLRNAGAMARIDESLERVGLGDRAKDKVGGYSLGMRQRLGLARCLLVDPKLMILDEPMNGLDPPGIMEIRSLIRSLVEEGKTVLISSHLLDEVEKTCDEIAIMSQGSILTSGTLEYILSGALGKITVRTSNNLDALEKLKLETSVASVEIDGNALKIALNNNVKDLDLALGAITRSIILSGTDIYEISQERASLESRFFEVTSAGINS